MKIYTIKEFAAKKAKTVRTIERWVLLGKLPPNHYAKKGGRESMIVEASMHEWMAEQYFDACCRYHSEKTRYDNSIELIAKIAIEDNLNMTKLCKMLGE